MWQYQKNETQMGDSPRPSVELRFLPSFGFENQEKEMKKKDGSSSRMPDRWTDGVAGLAPGSHN